MRFVGTISSGILFLCGCATSQTAQVPDSVTQYPAFETIGVGANPPNGAIVLFDGKQGRAAAAAELQAKWVKWRDWPNGCRPNSPGSTKNTSPANWQIARDPEFPNDTNRVALRTTHVTGPGTRWGCDDIEARPDLYAHGDARLHVEFNMMGKYDPADPDNPDSSTTYGTSPTADHYVNSGVYVQNRYEIQILSNPLGVAITDTHAAGSIVNEHPPSVNALRHNGEWQAYDIVFRAARWKDGKMIEPARMSVWLNGVLVHDNRAVTGKATGLRNTSGEPVGPELLGLKLQREAGDVRYRNIWMKNMKIDSMDAATAGY